MIYTKQDLQKIYEDVTLTATAHCVLRTRLVGGITPTEDGVRTFVKYQLKLDGDEAERAVKRIINEELNNVPVPSAEGEQDERYTYGLCSLHRSPYGPFVGSWMIKACAKVAASRLGIFVAKRGSKGDVAEMGRVYACGDSFKENSEHVHLVDDQGAPINTRFENFKGRVNLPIGSVSIVADREVAPEGTRFSFQYRWYDGKMTPKDMVKVLACMQSIGLGSAKAWECGKFEIEHLEVEDSKKAVVEEDSSNDELPATPNVLLKPKRGRPAKSTKVTSIANTTDEPMTAA